MATRAPVRVAVHVADDQGVFGAAGDGGAVLTARADGGDQQGAVGGVEHDLIQAARRDLDGLFDGLGLRGGGGQG